MYKDNETLITNNITNTLTSHVNKYHSGSAYPISSFMPVKFEFPNNFESNKMSGTNIVSASQDYIYRFITGTSKDGFITAKVKNSVIGNSKWTPVDVNYIAKCWQSGIVELYIYVPTTRTYYIPHVKGVSSCKGGIAGSSCEVNGIVLPNTDIH